MRLNSALVLKFQKLHLEKFDKPITYEAAELELLNLAELIRITRPIKDKGNDDEK